MKRFLRQPVVQFFAAGGAIFALYAALNPVSPTLSDPNKIVLTSTGAEQLAEKFRASWNRPPTEEELQGLMRDWAAEEALVREAKALGLDRDDVLVRNRLRQKMVFIIESPAGAMIPEDAELRAYYAANFNRYKRPGELSFSQVLLPANATADETRQLRVALENGADPQELGQRTPLPPLIENMAEPAVERVFGQGFGAELAALPQARWSGPIVSGYGQHLVRVSAAQPPTQPPLESLRDTVIADWRADKARELAHAHIEALLDDAELVLPDATAVLGQ